jgi:hypothetical protein
MARTVYNLDELDELNPEPVEFIVGGVTLKLGELPHQRLLRMQEEAAAMQAEVQGRTSEPVVIQGAMGKLVGILVDLFAPFNVDVAAATFDTLTPRKLMFLVEKAFESQMRMATTGSEENGGPPAMAGSRPEIQSLSLRELLYYLRATRRKLEQLYGSNPDDDPSDLYTRAAESFVLAPTLVM